LRLYFFGMLLLGWRVSAAFGGAKVEPRGWHSVADRWVAACLERDHTERRQSALGYLNPKEFAAQLAA
jgi:hypothetical protein